jgi:choline dehydrogenase-like flavoprotein
MDGSPSNDLPGEADVVIVGSGMAGLAVAAELGRRDGLDALVLESGPDASHEHTRLVLDEETALRIWLEPDSDPFFWRPYRTSGPGYLGLSGLRRRVGGRSLYWGGVMLPIEAWALRGGEWPEPVVADLVRGWDDGASLYARVSDEVAAWAGEADTRPGENGITFGDYAFTAAPRAVRHADDGRWMAYTPLSRWKPSADGTGGSSVPIFPGCHVLGVKLRAASVIGVQVLRGPDVVEIRAPRVVLAAGTIENSRLALQALADCGALRQPRLRGLVDKIAYGFTATFDPAKVPLVVANAARRGQLYYLPANEKLRSNHFLQLYLNELGTIVLDTWLMGEQVSGEAGQVCCDPAAEWPWRTHVIASLSPADLTLCTLQRTELARLWDHICDALGIGRSPLRFSSEHGSPDLRDRLLAPRGARGQTPAQTYSFPLGAEQHEAGTTPLGTMLDLTHQFRQVPGLFAAGPSSFARTGAANPSMTILALGMRLAAALSAS